MSAGYYEMIKKLEERVEQLEEKVSSNTEGTPLWKQVFGQTKYFGIHGQMEIAEIKLSEIRLLLKDLSANWDEDINDLFFLSMFEKEEGWSGSIYQTRSDKDKLWVSFDTIIID